MKAARRAAFMLHPPFRPLLHHRRINLTPTLMATASSLFFQPSDLRRSSLLIRSMRCFVKASRSSASWRASCKASRGAPYSCLERSSYSTSSCERSLSSARRASRLPFRVSSC
jgi:hypothetical protein